MTPRSAGATPLTAADLAEIRRQTILDQLALARRFGVSTVCIEAIVKGRPWQALAHDDVAQDDLFDKRT
jgi:DNA-binding XRE family transcriptional regulator